jgi:hypothetical protein
LPWYGPYLYTVKSAKAAAKAKDSGEFDNNENTAIDYRKNVIVEVSDAQTMKVLWSKSYPKEAPGAWIAPAYGSVAMVWDVSSETAKAEIKADPALAKRQAELKEKTGDYYLQILDIQTGNSLGKLLIETGKGSFRLENVLAAGDWVIVTDTQNRILVYSLKTGDLVGRAFGGYDTVSLAKQLLCVENEIGKLAIYDLNTMEKRDEYVFSNPISLLRFSTDGLRLFVLTKNQSVYFLKVAASGK